MKAMVQLDRDELNQLQYPVVVEMWKHIESSGSKRRLYLKEFDESERAKVRHWYERFYDWYLRRGTPESVVMSPNTLLWLQNKMIPFFGQL
jgi:hypothetical protein